MISEFDFLYPHMLLLLLLIPILIVWQWYYRKKRYASINYSQVEPFINAKKSKRIRLINLPNVIRYVIFFLIIITLARPQAYVKNKDNIEGIDIIITLDISSSMLAEDFKPNRLEAAKDVAKTFIEERSNDNIGIVLFSGEAYTQCPPTTDHNMLSKMLAEVYSGSIQDGTAIGDGLATAINRVKDTKTKSKAIILLTDGVNNMGVIDPLTAADIARSYGIRVYTIGVGKMGLAPYPVMTPLGKQYENVEVKIDEPLLKEIAKNTSGQYFRSTNKSTLETIFKEIDKMEKSIIDKSSFRNKSELSFPLIIAALILLVLEILIRKKYLNVNP